MFCYDCYYFHNTLKSSEGVSDLDHQVSLVCMAISGYQWRDSIIVYWLLSELLEAEVDKVFVRMSPIPTANKASKEEETTSISPLPISIEVYWV